METRIWEARQWICWGNLDGRKVPCDIHGNVIGSTHVDDYVDIETAYNACKQKKQLGLAFCFTKFDPFVGIDIDDCIDVKRGVLLSWAVPIQERFSHCYQEVSPSRTGIKIYCQGTLEAFGKSAVKVEHGAIEVYEHGRFFAVTMTRCGLVEHYETPPAQEAIDWLRANYFPAAKVRQPVDIGDHRLFEESTVIRRVFETAIAEQGAGRNNACFAMACQFRDNGIEEAKAIEVATVYSDHVTQPGKAFDHAEATRCVTSAYRQQRRDPWTSSIDLSGINDDLVSPDFYVDTPIDDSIDLPTIKISAMEDERKIDLIGEFPAKEFCKLSPVIRDFLDYYQTSAIYYQEQIGVGAALALISTLVSRKLISDTGSTANLYCAGVAPTGAGKEAPRGVIKYLLELTGLIDLFGGERFASGVAIARALAQNPTQLFLIDEFGLALRSASGATSAPHLREIVEILLTTFSSSDKLWLGKIYSDHRNNVRVQRPHAVLFATTTPETLWDGINTDAITNGLLGRMLLFEGTYVRANRVKKEKRLTTNLLGWMTAWGEYSPGGNLSGTAQGDPEMRVIEHSPEALERVYTHQESIAERRESEDAQRAAIWSRCAEKAGRLALCLAASRHLPGDEFRIELADINAAIRLANGTTRRMCNVAMEDIADSDFERKCQRVLKNILRRESQGKETGLREIYWTLRIKVRDARDVIESLLTQGKIVEQDGLFRSA